MISNSLLSRFSAFVADQLGLNFPPERWRDLERGLRAALSESNPNEDPDNYVQKLMGAPMTRAQIETLASHLTVGETYFFRETRSLETLIENIVPDLIRKRTAHDRQLRIWSAGCATGEEPYSIAIMLHKMMTDLKDWNISILATDLNVRSLQKASEGIYGEWSFRATPEAIKQRYFTATAQGRWTIIPSMKEMVKFSYLNLKEDSYPSLLNYTNAMDVILCRNVLMYFTGQTAKNAVGRFHRALVEGGWLMVSPVETSSVLFSQFKAVALSNTTLYEKAPVQRSVPERSLHTRVEHAPSTFTESTRYPAMERLESLKTSGDGTNHALFHEVSKNAVDENDDSKLPPAQPTSSAASYERALDLYERGQYESAAEMLAIVLSQHGESQNKTDNLQATLLLARTYANQGKLNEALKWCDRAIDTDKIVAQIHYLKAAILQEQGAIAEAKSSLQRAIYLEPEFVLGHFALGNLLLKHGKAEESEKCFANARSLLARCGPEDIVPESDGVSVQRLQEVISLQSRQLAQTEKVGKPVSREPNSPHSGKHQGIKIR